MKVILKQYVYKHGVAGDIVNVANGFARNFLIPRGLAVKATEKALHQNENLMAEAAIRRQELNDQLVSVSNQINGTHLLFGRKAGTNGKLYGSVTTSEIAEALLEKTGIDINRRRISDRGLRELGTFEIPVRMGNDLSPVLKVTIVREDDLPAYLEASAEELDKLTEEGAADEDMAWADAEQADAVASVEETSEEETTLEESDDLADSEGEFADSEEEEIVES